MLQQRSQTPSQTYFKHTVYGLRFLLKAEGLPYEHLHLPEIARPEKLPVILSRQEIWAMLKNAQLLKHKILIGLLYGCGLRCMEVRNIELCHLDFDRHLLQGKGFDGRYSQRGVQWAVKTVARQAGILKEVHTHMLRHTYATHLLEDGVNILTVQKLLGHSNIDSTMVYLHVCTLPQSLP